MESGFRGRVKASSVPSSVAFDNAYFAGTTHPSPGEHGKLASCPYRSVNPLTSPRFDYRGERNHADGFEDDMEMKIMIFSINMGKFTGFFDKFMETIILVKYTLFQIVAFVSSSKNRMFFRI